jgi:murein DD-endopeptidase MepM/ murein hydrolase activator NlpD
MPLKLKLTHRAPTSCALACVLAGVIAGGAAACRQPAPKARAAVRSHDIQLPRELTTVASQVPANATLPEILATHRIRPEHGTKFLQALTGVFDVRDLKAHHPYQIELTLDGWLRAFRYQIDTDRFLQVSIPPVTAAPAPAPPDTVFTAEVMPYRKERALVAVRGTIDEKNNSLVAAMDAAGEQIQLAIGLAEIFGGDIDFGHDLQPGDSFEVVFEQVLKEGARAGYGDIIAATFTNDGKTYSAFRYQVPGGKPGYYDELGRSLKRFFLASPLKFEPRVTSGFSYRRLHPVLGIRRPHLGVDFGAPRGAPVVAVSDGTVVSAAFTRGGGNTVTLRHTGGYETQYLHLSSFGAGIRGGAHVSQGQVIGRVGSTGLSTGPHLHYVLKRNGEHVNPIAEHRRHPPGDPISTEHRAAFEKARTEAHNRFVSASPSLVADARVQR